MICDNCGAEIDKNEIYCPNCGMELPRRGPKPSKKKHYKNSQKFSRDNLHSKDNYGNYPDEEYNYEVKPSKRKNYRDSADFTHDIPHPKANYENYDEEADYKRKPLKRKYYGNSPASASYDPHYQDEVGYESYYADEGDHKTKKSGSSLGTIFLLLIIVLLLGFIIGLFIFSSPQSLPQVPGLKS